MKKIMLLGSGELGRELTISLKRLGCDVTACDNYDYAPAMQVADRKAIFNMLDGDQLQEHIRAINPDLVVPEVEAIDTERLLQLVEKGPTDFHVVPTARAVNLTMNRDRIRQRAVELGIETAKHCYADNEEDLVKSYNEFGCKVVVKPVMSSSGKGQTIVEADDEIGIRTAWHTAVEKMRGDRPIVIIEEFIDFDYEITLLTVKQKNDLTLFCPAIVHEQEDGDYKRSYQMNDIPTPVESQARKIAKTITDDLGGAGLFGVEFFVTKDGNVLFSELSPRPHDTGMVTLYTQNLSEFDLHARAILGLPIPSIELLRTGASHAICADAAYEEYEIQGVESAMAIQDVDVRIFGKPLTYKNRRMAVVLGPTISVVNEAAKRVKITKKAG